MIPLRQIDFRFLGIYYLLLEVDFLGDLDQLILLEFDNIV